MIDWPFIIGYVAIGSVALFLQYKSNVVAMDRLAEAHQQNVNDLRMMVEVLQLSLMHANEAKEKAKLNRVTHADLMEGAIPD